ncbi:unnamed protein product [Owenia fusiformis]|uniref:G-protein coupled receptors family 3 profile domain-containing protein n=1 Tax=Owenia fusiformis TaxID=6347 RepID=A0A8S4N588_OWEFU|nr:unnamed protein product [Owenia fusiformis]
MHGHVRAQEGDITGAGEEGIELATDVKPNTYIEPYRVNVTQKHDIDDEEDEAVWQKQKTYTSRYGNFTWPRREQVAVVEGNITIGGLMMVHERSDSIVCGKVMPQGGIQATEAMLFTLDRINSDPTLKIPGVKLGARIKDDCDRDTYGLEQAVDFVRGSINNIGGSKYECDEESPEVIAGVVGASSSVTSIQVANLLKLFRIPQVSFFSTSPVLSDSNRYPYFMRTIPSDKNQADAMIALVKHFNWTYVSVVYEESSYGQWGFEEVKDRLLQNDICLAMSDKLKKDSGVAAEGAYDDVVKRLKQKSNARGVIVFGSDQEVGELMKAIKRAGMTGHFRWIGSDGWGGRTIVFKDGNQPMVEGAVTVQPFAQPIEGFEDYFLNLTPENNQRNPWFIEYWEDYFRCKYKDSLPTPFNAKYNTSCRGDEMQTKQNGYVAEAQLQYVSDATLAFAVALKRMHQDVCGGNPGLCAEMDPVPGQKLKKYLRESKFTGLSGVPFEFLPNGDGVPSYRILNFRRVPRRPEEFEWVTVGEFRDGELKINNSEIRFTLEETMPMSACSKPCKADEAIIYVSKTKCCWSCVKCYTYQYITANGEECKECPYGTRPSEKKDRCLPIPEEYLRYNSGIAITAMAISTIGIIATSYIIIVFIKYKDTPVVKASGRELSFVLLIGILMCYALTFLLVAKPTDIICGSQRIGVGFCFSICYAAVLTKTNRIARIFRSGKRTAKRPKFISPKSQLIICASVVAVQIIIGAIWLVLRPPKSTYHFPTREENQLVCESAIGPQYIIGFMYPIVLIMVCTFYAFLTRRIPEAFNESKHIGFTMYTTCIIWLAFVPIYFSTANNIEIRLATMCFSISLSGTVLLACMFTPKLYIIILHPERNIRQSMMSGKLTSKTNNSNSARMDSGTQSDAEMEMCERLKTSCSISSGLSTKSTCGTQTLSNGTGTTISTQTLNSIGLQFACEFDDMDVQL